jgi:hypothetical protein
MYPDGKRTGQVTLRKHAYTSLPSSNLYIPPPNPLRRTAARLVNEYRSEVLFPNDPLWLTTAKPYALSDSTVLNSPWTADENNRFFTALARCG